MHPILFQCRFFTIYSYGFFVALAMLTALALASQRSASYRLEKTQAADFLFALFISGIAGARLWYCFQHAEDYLSDPLRIFWIQEGGLVWYGGFFGATIAGAVYARFRRWPVLKLADFFAPILAAAHAVGRVGCFFNGCCYGLHTDSFWGVRFPGMSQAHLPAQLYESGLLLLLSFYLSRVPYDEKKEGRIFSLYLLGYGAIRFTVEFFRGDNSHFYHLTIPQWTSLVLIAGALLMLNRKSKNL